MQIFKNNLDIILIFLFSIVIFSYITLFLSTDITAHITHSVKINSTDTSYPANFLYYFILNLFSGFSNNLDILKVIAIVILSIAVTAKYCISKSLITYVSGVTINNILDKKIYIIALSLILSFAIPDPFSFFFIGNNMYLGKFVPIVWHNSTTIMLFPFAILLFWKQLKVFDQSNKTTINEIIIINILVIVNVLIKPSFIFVYIPVTTLFLLFRVRMETIKSVLIKLTPIFTGLIIIFFQYYLIYKLQSGSIQKEPSGVLISFPFQAFLNWGIPLWYVPISIFFSFTLPIFSIILYKEIIKYEPFLYSLCLTIVGILISAFIMESGPRSLHGNFMWQNVICTYLLFLSTILFLTPKFLNHTLKSKKIRLLIMVFFIHAFSGILYLFKIGWTLGYS